MITVEEILKSDVRVLTLNEPFASLMLCGKGETRKNPTNVRGIVCIHSAKKSYPAATVLNIAGQAQYNRIHSTTGPIKTMEHIIAIGRLVNCREMMPSDEDKCFVRYVEPWLEYSKKRNIVIQKRLWVYEFEDVTAVEPVKYRGSQGWTFLTPEEKLLIKPIA